jgi:hypothetical protein
MFDFNTLACLNGVEQALPVFQPAFACAAS